MKHFCGICNREIKDKKSIKRGMGPVCYKRYLAEKAAEDKKDEGDSDERSAAVPGSKMADC